MLRTLPNSHVFRLNALRAAKLSKRYWLTAPNETTNTANAGDWIVTNPGGEKYVVPAAKFPKKYEPCPELGDGWYKPTGGVQKFLELTEDTTFICSWGEEQHIKAGGFVNVTDLSDIYGIARDEFFDTYKECSEDGIFC